MNASDQDKLADDENAPKVVPKNNSSNPSSGSTGGPYKRASRLGGSGGGPGSG